MSKEKSNNQEIVRLVEELKKQIIKLFQQSIRERSPAHYFSKESGYQSLDKLRRSSSDLQLMSKKDVKKIVEGKVSAENKLKDLAQFSGNNKNNAGQKESMLKKYTDEEVILSKKYQVLQKIQLSLESKVTSSSDMGKQCQAFKDCVYKEQSFLDRQINEVVDWFFSLFSSPNYQVSVSLFSSSQQKEEIESYNAISSRLMCETKSK